MADRTPDAEGDHAWLLARERGEPGPPISEARARRYAQLGMLIANLPAVPAAVAQNAGWEQAVLAAIDEETDPPADPSKTPPPVSVEDPRSRVSTAPTRSRRRTATIMAGAFMMVASVAVLLFMHRDRSDSPRPAPEVTRGMHVEHGRLDLYHALQVRQSETAVPHELRDGDSVMSGDRIRASIRSSDDAHLYLAFCEDEHLKMFPSHQGIRTRAGELVLVPGDSSDFVVDAHLGVEVLYLILSRNELAFADPQLAELLAATTDGTRTVDCGAGLDAKLMKSTGTLPPTHVLRGETIPKMRNPRGGATDEAMGPGSVVAADTDDIAVVRYRWSHVAPERR